MMAYAFWKPIPRTTDDTRQTRFGEQPRLQKTDNNRPEDCRKKAAETSTPSQQPTMFF